MLLRRHKAKVEPKPKVEPKAAKIPKTEGKNKK